MPPTTPFDGLRVAAFESRMAGPMAELIRRHGGVPVVAPSLREIPITDNPAALDFARRLIAGEFDVVLFLTGVGTRQLARVIEEQLPRDEWIAALGRTEVVARGPKPIAALRELGARVDLAVPEPNTWNQILASLDDRRNLAGVRIAIQEYGKPSTELVEGLQQRGAEVTPVPVYRWAMPEDTEPLRMAAAAIAAGEIGAALFTSAQQVIHLLQITTEDAREDELRSAFQEAVVIGSIGPTTTETLLEQGFVADIEPEHPKMGHLVAAVASRWRQVPKRISELAFCRDAAENPSIVPSGAPEAAPPRPPQESNRFLRACRRLPTDVTPIWLMRQAGRYMPEYRELRAKVPFLELCKRPELATEVTVTAAEILGVDAAILFADILLILEPLGFQLEFGQGEGPIIHNPIRESSDVDRVADMTSADGLSFVMEAVRQIRAALPAHRALIGFAGAPFTLACYAIEGGSSRHYQRVKSFFYRDPGAWDVLMSRLVAATAAYLNAQVVAGAQALQVFDSWVGALAPDDYRQYILPHMKRLFQALNPDVPVIHFGTDTTGLLELQRDAGGDVIGLDWRIDLDEGWRRLGPDVAVQGNLDPVALLAPWPEIELRARRILQRAGGRPGHIFNLGHGILPQTPVEHVRALVDLVHSVPCAESR